MKRDFLSVLDLNLSEIKALFDLSLKLKKSSGEKVLEGKEIALIFEKPSLRTRVTFEAAISRLGGKPIYLSPQDIQLGKREAVKDVARNLSLWVSGIVARVFSHRDLEELARESSVPVINALSDLEHPCQALADFLSIYEVKGDFDIHLVFVGDGNNVASSLMLLSSILGSRFTLVCPEGYEVPNAIFEKAKELGEDRVRILRDPREGVRGADFIYTDVWTSMGQEAEREVRMRVFRPYQVNEELLSHAPKHAKVMHCLPAHRGEEITDGVLDSDRAIVLMQAENRLYTEMALFYAIYGV